MSKKFLSGIHVTGLAELTSGAKVTGLSNAVGDPALLQADGTMTFRSRSTFLTDICLGTSAQYVAGNGALFTFPTLIAAAELSTGTSTTERLISAERLTTWLNSFGFGLASANITAVSLSTTTLTLTRAAGNLTAAVPTWNQNTTGSAATLTTARTINGTSFNGSANITTATWGTARTLTLGASAKSVDGSANVSWSLAEMGAQPAGNYILRQFVADQYTDISNSDLNTFSTGVTYAGSSSLNRPPSGNSTVFSVAVNALYGYQLGGRNRQLYWRDNENGAWNTWQRVYLEDFHPEADKWTTARTITIGSTGKAVDGSANVSWSLGEIGAAAASHTHAAADIVSGILSYDRLPISATEVANWNTAYSWGNHAGNYVPLVGASRIQSAGLSTSWGVTSGVNTGAFNTIMGTSTSATWLISGTSNGTFRGGIQLLDGGGSMRIYVGSNYLTFDGTSLYDTNLSGNATTATTLQTARTINGTSFNGSANITTSFWGTSRVITIGSTGKSVDGSGNVTWTLGEIGAAASSHTHVWSDITNAPVKISLAELQAGVATTDRLVDSKNLNDWVSGIISAQTAGNGYTENLFTYSVSNIFTLSQGNPMALAVFLNGQRLIAGSDFTQTGNQLTVSTTLNSGDEILATYFYSIGGVSLSGAGTAGKLAKWSSSSGLTDSLVSEAGTKVSVAGTLKVDTALNGAGNFVTRTALGDIQERTPAQAVADLGLSSPVYIHTQSVANTTWTVTHNLGISHPLVNVYDDTNKAVAPKDIEILTNNSIRVTFHQAVAGTVTVAGGSLAVITENQAIAHSLIFG